MCYWFAREHGNADALVLGMMNKQDCSELVANEEVLFGERKFAMEPFFVQRPGSDVEDDGWVLCLVHDAEVQGTEVAIIDAQKFGEGPVATIKLPQYIPFGVHGSWSEEYVAGPDGSYAAKSKSS